VTAPKAEKPLLEKLPLLRRLNLFEEMSEDEVEAVSKQLTMTRCPTGQEVYIGKPKRVYLLKTGRVRLYRLSPDGDEVTTAILIPGQLFGTTSLFGEGDDTDSAAALDESYVCEATAPEFLGIMAKHPLLMAKVMMAMARQMFRLQRTVEELVRDSVSMRLARHLLDRAGEGEPVSDGILLPPQTRDEMATLVVSTRESVSRALGQWVRAGIIALPGRRILVRNVDALSAQAGNEVAHAPGQSERHGGRHDR
jgi:CRP/FNR family transcriptional regulator